MSLKGRFTDLVVKGVQQRLGVFRIEDLSDAEIADLRVIARLYLILDRRPVYASALRHVADAVAEHFVVERAAPLTRCLIGCLTIETARAYESIGHETEARALDRVAASWFPQGADSAVLHLVSAIAGSKRLHQLPALALDATVRALSFMVDQSDRIDRSKTLAACASAAFQTANVALLDRVATRLEEVASSPGYTALALFYRSRSTMAQGQHEEKDTLILRLHEVMAALPQSDPVYQAARGLYKFVVDAPEHLTGQSPEQRTVLHRAADAMQREDWATAARLYGRIADEAEPGAFRAECRCFSEQARWLAGELRSSAALHAALDRLEADDLFRVRSRKSIEYLLTYQLGQAIDLHLSGDDTAPVDRIADLLGEARGGAALGGDLRNPQDFRSDALADLSLADLLARSGSDLRNDTVDAFPEHVKVWASFAHQRDERLLVAVTSVPGEAPRVRREVLDDRELAALRACIGSSSEEAEQSELDSIRSRLFADVPAESAGLIVIPDRMVWSLPWLRLVPEPVSEAVVAVSLRSAHRLPSVAAPSVPKVIGLFDREGLIGSERELAGLRALHDAGKIAFTGVDSLRELASELDRGSFDLLTIGVHGDAGDGFQYRLLFPEGPSSPTALLSMRLPPRVVLGCCWSAQTNIRRDTLATALVCLLGGASQVVGGLWDVDDATVGELLADTYGRFAAGRSLPEAFRSAQAEMDPDGRRLAGGLVLFGRPD
jgi:hypothetical protein